MRYLVPVFVVLFAAVCVSVGIIDHMTPRGPAGPPVVMDVLDPNLDTFAGMWQQEIGRRFPHAVGILCHGGDFVEGQWIVSAKSYEHIVPVTELVEHVRKQFPDRTIVLLACNPGHLRLGIPGVYYAHSSVWCVPDRALTPEMFSRATQTLDSGYEIGGDQSRWQTAPEVVGNIYEFDTDH